jgi:hypothetical protein
MNTTNTTHDERDGTPLDHVTFETEYGYSCGDCDRSFPSLTDLINHLPCEV